jgi:hypothetical protein
MTLNHRIQVGLRYRMADQLRQSIWQADLRISPGPMDPKPGSSEICMRQMYQLTIAASTCLSNTRRMFSFTDSSLLRKSEVGSRSFFPDATAISSCVICAGEHSFITRYRQYIGLEVDFRLPITPVGSGT